MDLDVGAGRGRVEVGVALCGRGVCLRCGKLGWWTGTWDLSTLKGDA